MPDHTTGKGKLCRLDDGPLHPIVPVSRHSRLRNVKATYFIVGLARAYRILRVSMLKATRLAHSQNHPLIFNKIPIEDVQERSNGYSLDRCAGIRKMVAPFPYSRSCACNFRRNLLALTRAHDLERRFRRRRLEAHPSKRFNRPCTSSDRGHGERHIASARYPAGNRAGIAIVAPRTQGSRLSHRAYRACEHRATEDRDRTAGLDSGPVRTGFVTPGRYQTADSGAESSGRFNRTFIILLEPQRFPYALGFRWSETENFL